MSQVIREDIVTVGLVFFGRNHFQLSFCYRLSSLDMQLSNHVRLSPSSALLLSVIFIYLYRCHCLSVCPH